ATGAVYGSLALAIVLIYRATEVINLAQGEMAMFSTYICWQLLAWGVGYWGAFFATLAISFTGGMLIERIVIRPVQRGGLLAVVIVTIGLFLVINGLALFIWTGETKSLEAPFTSTPLEVGG